MYVAERIPEAIIVYFLSHNREYVNSIAMLSLSLAIYYICILLIPFTVQSSCYISSRVGRRSRVKKKKRKNDENNE